MMRTALAIAAAAAGLTPPLVAQTASPPGLDTLRDTYVAAYNAGDAEGMADLYVPEAVRMPYDAQMQEGREAILAYYRGAFARRTLQPTLTLTADELTVRGDLAIERGRYHEVLRPRGKGRALLEVGKYVAVARRGPDGKWRYTLSIFNRDAPAAPLPPTEGDQTP